MAPLDGLRGISIALVLLGHLDGTFGFPENDLTYFIGDYANLGVIVFFVISGFLISSLLMEEQQEFGNISLRLFYGRRFLRLAPAFLCFLGFILMIQWAGWIRLNPGDTLASLTYTVNFRRTNSWYIGHLWSLSVEEQFYLLWPAALVLAGLRRARWVICGVMAVSPIARYLAMGHVPGTIFPCVADSLAWGCFLALCGADLRSQKWYERLTSAKLFVPGAVLVILACNGLRSSVIGIVFGVSLINVLIACIIHRCIVAKSRMTAVLSLRPMVGVGVLSYSLYLWQQFFLNRESVWPICEFPANLLLAIAAAVGSYYLVERPLNGLRRNLRRT